MVVISFFLTESTSLLYHFPERGLKLHLLEMFPFLCNARIYALRLKKPGFLPHLWTTTKYFPKKTRFLGPYLACLPLPQEGIDIKSRGIGINLTHSQETAVPFFVSTSGKTHSPSGVETPASK